MRSDGQGSQGAPWLAGAARGSGNVDLRAGGAECHGSVRCYRVAVIALRSHIGAMAEPVILVENLVKRYGATVAVDGIGFAVEPGVTAALLGGNGAGKTTTLSILLGLLLPTSGTVRVFGEDVLRHRYRVLPRMNFSSPYVDLPHRLTVRQNLQIYARLYGVPRRARAHRATGRRSADRPVARPAGRQIVVRTEDPRRARQGAAQRARIAAARRADRLARPGYRRLGARLSRGLPRPHRRDDPAGLAQHGRGRAAVLARS